MVDSYEVFIAHASADKDHARELHRALTERGARVFFDESLEPGERWPSAIPAALRASKTVVVLVSARVGEALYLHDEIADAVARARRGELRLVPVLLEKNLLTAESYPYGLRVFQHLDYAVLGAGGVAEKLLRGALPAAVSRRVVVQMRIEGDAERFNEASFRASLVELLGTGVGDLQLKVGRGSVRITIDGAEETIARLLDLLSGRSEALRRFEDEILLLEVRCDDRTLGFQRTFAKGPRPSSDQRPSLTWLHVSDLHFGHGDATHRADQEALLERLIEDAQRMADRRGSPDLILVTGDLAYSGQPDQYRQATHWLARLRRAVGAGVEAFCIVPGNHDVDRSMVIGSAMDVHDAIERDLRKLDERLGGEDAPLLTKKLAAYRALADAHGSALDGDRAPWWRRNVEDHRLGALRIVGLNTAIASCDGRDATRLVLGARQRTDALRGLRAEGPLALVLMHHPPSAIRDGEELLATLRSIPAIVFSGHVHRAKAQANVPFGLGGLVHVQAGAAHGDQNEREPHGYAWGRIDLEGMRIFPRVYSKEVGGFVPDTRQGPLDPHEAHTRLKQKLPDPLERWLLARARALRPPEPQLPPKPPGTDPVVRDDPYPRGSLGSTLFRAFQLDRTRQWDRIVSAHAFRYAVLVCHGHPRQSLSLLETRMRHDLERHISGRATKVILAPFKDGELDPGPASSDDWIRRIAMKSDRRAADAVTAILDVGREQETLVLLGPIREEGLAHAHRTAVLDLLSRALPDLLVRHAAERTKGFRVVVLVADALPLKEAPGERSELAEALGSAAQTGLRRLAPDPGRPAEAPDSQAAPTILVERLPRAKFPDWEEDVEPALTAASATPEQREEALEAYRALFAQPKRHFAQFAQDLESILDRL